LSQIHAPLLVNKEKHLSNLWTLTYIFAHACTRQGKHNIRYMIKIHFFYKFGTKMDSYFVLFSKFLIYFRCFFQIVIIILIWYFFWLFRFFPQTKLKPDGRYQEFGQNLELKIHPSSVLFGSKPGFIMFNELCETNSLYARSIFIAEPEWAFEACPTWFKTRRMNLE